MKLKLFIFERNSLPFQHFPQPRVPALAHGQSAAVLQYRYPALGGALLQAHEAVQLDDEAAVDAQEFRWIQLCFQIRDSAVDAIGLAARNGICQFVLCIEMRHRGKIYELKAIPQP